MEACPCSSDG